MKSSATANPVLTGYATKFMLDRAAYVALALAPLFLTAEQSAQYYVFDDANFHTLPTDIKRAPSAGYTRSLMKVSDDSYACNEYGHEEPVDDSERKKYSRAIDADVAAVGRITNILRYNQEIRVKTLATSGAVPTATPSTKWDNSASDPVKDVDAAKTNIHKNTGMEANTMIVNRDVFLTLKEHAKVIEKIKYTQRGVVTADILAEVFGVSRFIIAGSIHNTAHEGQTASLSYLWGDAVIVAHVNAAQDLKSPTFLRTFGWTGEVGPDGILVESYRQDTIRSDIHRARQYVSEKIIAAKCGYHLSDVLT